MLYGGRSILPWQFSREGKPLQQEKMMATPWVRRPAPMPVSMAIIITTIITSITTTLQPAIGAKLPRPPVLPNQIDGLSGRSSSDVGTSTK
mmetsp:Transcript_39148/g.84537  ORF Transcript_39148/g.84537 Transcript_39148/m.84537 type:complete len:91 (+) Transcript_39148:156-428(+)